MNDSDSLMTIWDHLEDFRSTFIRMIVVVIFGWILSFIFYEQLLNLLTSNWSVVHQNGETVLKPALLILGPLDGFYLIFTVCFWTGLGVTFPIWGAFLFKFMAPGLRGEEKRVLIVFSLLSMILVSCALWMAHQFTIPLANHYFEALNRRIGVNAWVLNEYVNYTLMIYVGHCVLLELGLILFSFVHLGYVSTAWLVSKRKLMVIVALMIGALVTPPDIPSQLMMAIPLIFLYEIAILYSHYRRLPG